jgi:hypothetical protein
MEIPKQTPRKNDMKSVSPQGSGRTARHADEVQLLRHVEALRACGQHRRAIEAVDGASDRLHTCYAVARALSLKARSQSVERDDAGALQTLQQLPASAVRTHPDIATWFHLVRGQLYRRRAHATWKKGQFDHSLADSAIRDFRQARECGDKSGIARLVGQASQNEVYVHGLVAAVESRSETVNPQLLQQIIPIEALTQGQTPRDEPIDLLGLIMAADLAFGASLSVRDVFALGQGAHVAACWAVLQSPDLDWPELLQRQATKADLRVPTTHRLRALVLGSRFLLKSGVPSPSAVDKYLTTMLDVFLHGSGADTPNRVDLDVPGLHEQGRKLREFASDKIMSLPVLNRRWFR